MLATLTGLSVLQRKEAAGACGEFEPLWTLLTQPEDLQIEGQGCTLQF
jgi:hypothetical protein